jgi:hypothetical protein
VPEKKSRAGGIEAIDRAGAWAGQNHRLRPATPCTLRPSTRTLAPDATHFLEGGGICALYAAFMRLWPCPVSNLYAVESTLGSPEMETGEGMMSVMEIDTAARPTVAEAEPPSRRVFVRALSWRDRSEGNAYSPALCFSVLLALGLIIKIGPAIHVYLAQIW